MKIEKETLGNLLMELKFGLAGTYGSRLKGVYLYGSYARDEADEESDVDILVVLEQFDRYAQEVDRTAELASDMSLKYGISVSEVFVREADWLGRDTPFLLNIREEAISL